MMDYRDAEFYEYEHYKEVYRYAMGADSTPPTLEAIRPDHTFRLAVLERWASNHDIDHPA